MKLKLVLHMITIVWLRDFCYKLVFLSLFLDALEAANKQLEKGVVGFKKTAQHVKDHVKETAVQIKEKMTDKVTPIFELGQAKRAEAGK